MKILRLLIFTPLLMAFQCDDEINIEEDRLFQTGIYGGWELASQTVNGMMDTSTLPEVILEFSADNNTEDNRGQYNLAEPDVNTIGVFIMDETEQLITLQREGEAEVVYGYVINRSENNLTLSFTENEAQIERQWQKIY